MLLVPVALNQAYSYRVPRGVELKPGDVVCVPAGAARGGRRGLGGKRQSRFRGLHNRLKDIGEKLDVPPLKEELRSLVDWVANSRCRRAAWCCGCACGWANISGPNGCGWACV